MKTTIVVDTFDNLQGAVMQHTRDLSPGYSYTVRPLDGQYELIVDDGQHEHIASKDCPCGPVTVDDFRE